MILGFDIGVIFYYVVFVMLIHVIMSMYFGFNSLRFYLTELEAIALVMATIEKDNLFNGLYEKHSENATGLISTSIIIFLTLYGVIWQNLYFFNNNRNMYKALLRSSIMIFTVFLIPAYLIPYSMIKTQSSITSNVKSNIESNIESNLDPTEEITLWQTLSPYIVGISIIIILNIIEYLLIKYLVN
jgi:hypothetical protein